MSTQSEPMSLDEIIEDSQVTTSAEANKFSSYKTCVSGDLRSIDELRILYLCIFLAHSCFTYLENKYLVFLIFLLFNHWYLFVSINLLTKIHFFLTSRTF